MMQSRLSFRALLTAIILVMSNSHSLASTKQPEPDGLRYVEDRVAEDCAIRMRDSYAKIADTTPLHLTQEESREYLQWHMKLDLDKYRKCISSSSKLKYWYHFKE